MLGLDISDTITLDPGRMAQYTPPMTLNAAYGSLVTFETGDYINVKPSLAESWARTADGKAIRFKLRELHWYDAALVESEFTQADADRLGKQAKERLSKEFEKRKGLE